MHCIKVLSLLLVIFFFRVETHAQILDKQKQLNRFTFWSNKDWDWYKERIPFFESPDNEIDKTYYYRWEMMTVHLVYGSPTTGYASTEFIDRPWWSDTYGAISCPVGHQLYEFRWFRDPEYAFDYSRYWFQTPGARPRNYSNWLGDAIWQVYKVHKDENLIADLLPSIEKNYQGWEKERWVEAEGMFAWDGMHDGMETNINSRQTKKWFEGAPGYRPTLNSYMWADAKAISEMAVLQGNTALAQKYNQKAAGIKNQLQQKLWDPEREFFFHRFQNDEEGGIKANTLTYETGKYAGSKHGRELIGFIPWYFNLPDEGFESAWKYLFDTAYFATPFGPTTVEKNDPLFNIAKNCCAWSGNAWPYGTSQTLKGLANLIKYYPNSPANANDYYALLNQYARTHRKNGLPYIAEANHPYTGSWDGHDNYNHSEHYFHSSYIDNVITGLAGVEPMAGDSVEVFPLIPDNWEYFALDDLYYHGRNLSVIWDKTGNKYNRGKGLLVLIDGKLVAQSPTIKRLVVHVAQGRPVQKQHLVNYAVNNERDAYYPRIKAIFPGVGQETYLKLNDGQFWYHELPPNRWTSWQAGKNQQWIEVDFGGSRPIEELALYFVEGIESIAAPKNYTIEYKVNGKWEIIPSQNRKLKKPMGNRANRISFPEIHTSAIRINLKPTSGKEVSISEIEAWGKPMENLPVSEGEANNLAYYKNASFSCSYTSRFDQKKGINDGLANPAVRWTAFESPNETDWVQFDFKSPQEVSRILLFFYNDGNGVKPPENYAINYLVDNKWEKAEVLNKIPAQPGKDLNNCYIKPVTTHSIRILLTHINKKSFAGLYEVEIY